MGVRCGSPLNKILLSQQAFRFEHNQPDALEAHKQDMIMVVAVTTCMALAHSYLFEHGLLSILMNSHTI